MGFLIALLLSLFQAPERHTLHDTCRPVPAAQITCSRDGCHASATLISTHDPLICHG